MPIRGHVVLVLSAGCPRWALLQLWLLPSRAIRSVKGRAHGGVQGYRMQAAV